MMNQEETILIKPIEADIIERIHDKFRYTKFTCFTDINGNKIEMTYNSNTEHNDMKCKVIYILYKNYAGAISKMDINSARNIIIGQPRINFMDELEMCDNMSIYRIDDVIPFIIEDIYELTGIAYEITYEMVFNLLETAGFNLYNTDNYMTGKTVIEMYNKVKRLQENPESTIECCICYMENTIDNIIITRCCKNLYCKNCIMRLKKCSVCSKDF
jgi:hypothetical protein